MTREELIITMAKKAGEVICSIHPSPTQTIAKEGTHNYVTMADKTSEAIIFSFIREHTPNDLVFSEETASTLDLSNAGSIDHLWIIDPIDGTVNYQKGRKYSAISIAYIQRGIPMLGVVYDPYRDELFEAKRGRGATRNGNRIYVEANTNSNEMTVITDNSYDPQIIRLHLETVLKLPITPWTIMNGSTALEICEVASGQANIFFNFCPKPWDIAAALLILEESGGVAKNRKGETVDYRSPEVICGNEFLVDQFIQSIRQSS